MALEPYFFCVCLSASIIAISFVFAFNFSYLHNLTVHHNTATNNAQYRENGRENTFGSKPGVDQSANKKAKNNTTGHRKADLHDNLQIFGPVPVFFIIEKLFFRSRHPGTKYRFEKSEY